MKFKRVALVGNQTGEIKATVENAGRKVVAKNPDAVISYGGDGTLLLAERLYPGVPKLGVKKSAHCAKCHPHTVVFGKTKRLCVKCLQNEVESLEGHAMREEMKIEAKTKGKTLLALNEARLHAVNPLEAVRIKVEVNGKPWTDYAVCDGFVVSTPFGSTGYFKSITRKTFSKGVGITLNNATKYKPPKVIARNLSELKIEATVLRNKALLIADNNPNMITLKEGDKAVFRVAKQKARIIY